MTRQPLSILLAALLCACATTSDPPPRAAFALAIHGGAGTIRRADLTPQLEAEYRATLVSALQTGYAVLEAGGSAQDAVVAALLPLEDSPLFNAGVGAVLTAEGTVELDASIMEGAQRNAGAVAGVTTVRHPIALARLVMEQSPHVMLVGAGAERFADRFDLQRVDNAFFHTERRLRELQEARRAQPSVGERKFGTVGAVALDRNGHLAAATSTGGMTNKQYGRVGDSPILGAGTWADDATCAVSATGHGEYFIRCAVAHDISARMRDLGIDVATAARQVIDGEVARLGGTGGVIALDRFGNVAMPFNTEGMYRGQVQEGGKLEVRIWADEDE